MSRNSRDSKVNGLVAGTTHALVQGVTQAFKSTASALDQENAERGEFIPPRSPTILSAASTTLSSPEAISKKTSKAQATTLTEAQYRNMPEALAFFAAENNYGDLLEHLLSNPFNTHSLQEIFPKEFKLFHQKISRTQYPVFQQKLLNAHKAKLCNLLTIIINSLHFGRIKTSNPDNILPLKLKFQFQLCASQAPPDIALLALKDGLYRTKSQLSTTSYFHNEETGERIKTTHTDSIYTLNPIYDIIKHHAKKIRQHLIEQIGEAEYLKVINELSCDLIPFNLNENQYISDYKKDQQKPSDANEGFREYLATLGKAQAQPFMLKDAVRLDAADTNGNNLLAQAITTGNSEIVNRIFSIAAQDETTERQLLTPLLTHKNHHGESALTLRDSNDNSIWHQVCMNPEGDETLAAVEKAYQSTVSETDQTIENPYLQLNLDAQTVYNITNKAARAAYNEAVEAKSIAEKVDKAFESILEEYLDKALAKRFWIRAEERDQVLKAKRDLIIEKKVMIQEILNNSNSTHKEAAEVFINWLNQLLEDQKFCDILDKDSGLSPTFPRWNERSKTLRLLDDLKQNIQISTEDTRDRKERVNNSESTLLEIEIPDFQPCTSPEFRRITRSELRTETEKFTAVFKQAKNFNNITHYFNKYKTKVDKCFGLVNSYFKRKIETAQNKKTEIGKKLQAKIDIASEEFKIFTGDLISTSGLNTLGVFAQCNNKLKETLEANRGLFKSDSGRLLGMGRRTAKAA